MGQKSQNASFFNYMFQGVCAALGVLVAPFLLLPTKPANRDTLPYMPWDIVRSWS